MCHFVLLKCNLHIKNKAYIYHITLQVRERRVSARAHLPDEQCANAMKRMEIIKNDVDTRTKVK